VLPPSSLFTLLYIKYHLLALVDYSPRDNIREIDGIILSKFDTVDEKGKYL
jgi:hypothetical protein